MLETVAAFFREIGPSFYIVPMNEEYNSIKDIPDYLVRAVPFWLILITMEFYYGLWTRRQLYTLKDTVLSSSLGLVQQLANMWMKEFFLIPYIYTYTAFAPLRAVMFAHFVKHFPFLGNLSPCVTGVIVFWAGLLGCDFGYYLLHRCAHEWQIMWSGHSVHHSGERYNLATALRQGAVQSLFSWAFYLPAAAAGLSCAALHPTQTA